MTDSRTSGRPGAALAGLTDTNEVPLTLNARGRPMIRDRLQLPTEAMELLDPLVWTAWAPRKTNLPALPHPDWAVNMLADADDYATALAWHDGWLGTAVPVFNHPRAIAQTRRDLSAKRLSGVPGLVVPACVRFMADGIAAFEETLAKHGFRFPVLIRPCGDDGSKGQLRIDGPGGWAAACDTPWFGMRHFMTQYVETATEGGLSLKARVLLIGGKVFLHHVQAAAHEQVNHERAGWNRDLNEMAVMDRLEADPVFNTLCAEIAARTHLDFTGLDIGVDPDRGRYVLFECNPAMAAFVDLDSNETAERLARRTRGQASAAMAVTTLLTEHHRWASARGSLQNLPPVREALHTGTPTQA